MGAELQWVQPNVGNPLRNEPGVLPGRQTLTAAATAREQKLAGLLAGHLDIIVKGAGSVR